MLGVAAFLGERLAMLPALTAYAPPGASRTFQRAAELRAATQPYHVGGHPLVLARLPTALEVEAPTAALALAGVEEAAV